MRHFDAEGKGQIDYNGFCETVFDKDYGANAPPQLKIDAAALGEYADTAAQKTVDRAESEKIRRAVKTIGEVFWSRANMSVRLRAEFSKMTTDEYLPWDKIRTAFLHLGYLNFCTLSLLQNFCTLSQNRLFAPWVLLTNFCNLFFFCRFLIRFVFPKNDCLTLTMCFQTETGIWVEKWEITRKKNNLQVHVRARGCATMHSIYRSRVRYQQSELLPLLAKIEEHLPRYVR